MIRISGMNGNEIFCLRQKGLEAGEIVVGNSVVSMGVTGALGSLGRSLAGGEMTGSDVTGPLVLRAKSKDVELNGFSDAVELNVDRGDLTLQPAASAIGKLSAVTRAGNVELILPAAAKFALDARTRRGELTNDYGAPLRETSEGRGGSLAGSVGAGPRLLLETDRGDIRVRKVEGRPAPVEVEKPLEPAPPTPPRTPLPLERSVQ